MGQRSDRPVQPKQPAASGLSLQHLSALHDALAEAELLDDSETGEATRNVVSSPLAGLDPVAVLDIRPIAKSLERHLAYHASLHTLPDKFGFAIDDGGLLGLAALPLRPMESGDGLIVRLRLTGGIVDVPLAQRIARWSSRWGNGQIDLSSRGNLQLRGLSIQHLPALHDALAEARTP